MSNNRTSVSKTALDWTPEAYTMAKQARVLSGDKLEELVVRLQRHSGRKKDQCWRFIIQNGLKRNTDHRRCSDKEFDALREELVQNSVEEVAKKHHRTPQAIRSLLRRRHLKLRDIRCDLFSIESLSAALRIRKNEIHFWIDQGWLQARVESRGARRTYTITPESLNQMFRRHLSDLLARGAPNLSLFEAYVQYCFSPKHTLGTQLLSVRRDKKERASYDASRHKTDGEDPEEDHEEDDDRYGLNLEDDDELAEA
jgi:hypothetical protein